ncbi:MAG TPA: MFS transporter [Sphingomonas sp.]|jgi:predicted MFS family arabinose efflux permease|uniref:MFS transporter n=1 Tax=Sphingomonas sp. TaxID=28214 RepID=UPI002EDB9556
MSRPPVSRHERRAVAILAIGFGLVGIDRFLISTLYPTIARDLGLGYADIGVIAGALALAWGVAALVMGNLSDRIGHRPVLVGSLVIFSLLIGGSGLATGLGGLILVRVVMGFADGAYTPASIAATICASPPERHGGNVGLQQTMLVLFGLGLSPLLVGVLLRAGLDWRYIFLVFTLPGLVVAWATWRIIPPAPIATGKRASVADWRAVLAYRNIRLLMAGMLCWLTCLIVTSAFLPSYLVDHLKLDADRMGMVMSAIGFGAVAGTILMSALSDRIGRRPVMVMSAIGTLAALVALSRTGATAGPLFACLFAVHFFNNALITLTVGPIAIETVPLTLMTTASGVVIATGEVLGGGIAPMLGGWVAEYFGIRHILWLPIAAMAAGILLCLALDETHKKATP